MPNCNSTMQYLWNTPFHIMPDIRRDGRIWVDHPSSLFGQLCNFRVNTDKSQTNGLNIDTCHFLARRLALLGLDKGWLENVSEWDIRSCCWLPGHPMREYYKAAMSSHCDKSASILLWPEMLLGRTFNVSLRQKEFSTYLMLRKHEILDYTRSILVPCSLHSHVMRNYTSILQYVRNSTCT